MSSLKSLLLFPVPNHAQIQSITRPSWRSAVLFLESTQPGNEATVLLCYPTLHGCMILTSNESILHYIYFISGT